ncbi:MAG: response regulator [Muribaculaceae bacterium]|nr:response regulator [Muribaculaceae bacterium]
MIKKILFLAFAIGLTFVAPHTASLSAADSDRINVLFIQSYGKSNSWSDKMTEALASSISDAGYKPNISVEYLNANLWSQEDKESVMRNFLRRGFQNGTNVIVTEGDEAFNTYYDAGGPEILDVPLVFFDVQYPYQHRMQNLSGATGLTSEKNYETFLRESIKTFPDRKEFMFVHSNDSNSTIAFENTMSAWRKLSSKYPGYRFHEFNTQRRDLESLITLITDPDNIKRYILIVPKSSAVFALKPQAPVYSFDSADTEVLAYYDVSPIESASQAGDMVSMLAGGATTGELTVRNIEPKMYYDYNELKKFNADIKSVEERPGNVVNYEFISRYRQEVIIGAIVMFVLLILLLVYLLSSLRNQSNRRRVAERDVEISKQLVKQRDEYDQLFSSITSGLVRLDENMKINFVNKAFVEMLGLNYDEETIHMFEGVPCDDVLHIFVNSKDVLDQLLVEVVETKSFVPFPDGSYMYHRVSNTYFPVRGELVPFIQDGIVKGVIIVCRNVSEEENQRQMLTTAAKINDIYPWQYDMAKNNLIFSQDFYYALGIPPMEFMTRSQFTSYIYHDDVLAMVEYLDAVREGSASLDDVNVRLKMSDGSYQWWDFATSPVSSMNQSGMATVVIGICQIVQKYKDTEAALMKARDDAQKSDKLKSAFLANMSHEVRTPLNAIVGFSNLMAYTDDPEKKQEYLNVIDKNNELLTQLINDVLDLAKIDSGTLDFTYTMVDVNELIRTAEDTVRFRVKRGVVLNYILGAQACQIEADGNRLLQVLTNMLNNATKFTVKGSITFGYEARPDEVYFFVKDTGRGIPPENIDKVFQRFFKTNDFAQGTGLGLAISQNIIRTLHGEIGVESRGLNKGTTFWFTVPYSQAPFRQQDASNKNITSKVEQHAPAPAQAPTSNTTTQQLSNPQTAVTHKPAETADDNPDKYGAPGWDIVDSSRWKKNDSPVQPTTPVEPSAPATPQPAQSYTDGGTTQQPINPTTLGPTVAPVQPVAPTVQPETPAQPYTPAAHAQPVSQPSGIGYQPSAPAPASAPVQPTPSNYSTTQQPVSPVTPVQPAAAPTPVTQAPAAPTAVQTNFAEQANARKLVLIAEDNPSNYLLFENILNSHYNLVHAWNGNEAVDLFKEYNPDLILMDISMPEKDGYAATADIREVSVDVPIIAVTAYAFASDRERILRSGFNGYISKPVNPGRLLQEIKKSIK